MPKSAKCFVFKGVPLSVIKYNYNKSICYVHNIVHIILVHHEICHFKPYVTCKEASDDELQPKIYCYRTL